MWILRNENKGLVYRVQPGKQNVISRKDGDLLLLGDQSISRKHAEITIQSENQRGKIVLIDLGSKYGTFAAFGGKELTQVSPNQPITLNDGDEIRFGIQWNVWRVEFFPLVVATSTLNAGEKAEVKEVVTTLGGEVVNDWQHCCTHLTMNKLTVTVKVVCALACGKPIVVPGYWKTLKDALASTEAKLPDYKDFVPPLAEALLNPSDVSFTPNPDRAKLFSGYTFVAASPKQLDRIKPMITAAGGNAVEFSTECWPHSKLKKDKTVLMLLPQTKQGSQQSQVPSGYMATARKLKENGLRCIPESEIGLSILYCSMAQYCNPKFSHQSLFGGSSSQNTQPITVVCPSSEDSINSKVNGDKSAPTRSRKRVLENSSDDENPRKKTNSEDIFSSEGEENRIDQNANLPSTSSNKSGPKENQLTVNRSLDMFAPSGSNQNKNTLNNQKSTLSGNTPKTKQGVVNPSLDMFAPSGQSFNKGDYNQVTPSCQDIFASNESRQSQQNKRILNNRSGSVPNKIPKLINDEDDEVDDVFSFTKNKKNIKVQQTVTENDDEFSFASDRRSSRRQHEKDEEDVFSFVSTKKSNRSTIEVNDDFSFVSSKNSKKRNRPGSSDMFDSSDNRPSCSNAKSRNFTCNENEEDVDDVFAFVGGPASKKMKENDSSLNRDEPYEEVELAIFSKKDDSNLVLQDTSEPVVIEDPPDKNKNVVFSKNKLRTMKEAVEDEEMDELAKELNNTTIVIFKPLLVAKPKPAEASMASGGKNFKKFRKVTCLNKRVVPHIIGGSDLYPHYANCENIKDLLPPSPPGEEPDDDWAFVTDKKKKGRK